MNSIAAVVFFAVVAAASAGIVAPSGLIASTYAAPALTAYSAPLAYNAHLAYSGLAAPAYTAYSGALGHAAESTVVAGPSGTITKTDSIATPAVASLAYNAPLAYSGLAAPAYTAYSSPIAYSGALGHAAENTVVAGPSGTITNTKSIAAPAIAARYALPSAYTYGGLYL
ncbi:cuticle protein 12.5-like [Harmonia axyridis]|uniref:cuticle protein 12.5-like n=1 Tax=Harmonia axyridis TaxID=115357 RepID=UPI001E278180|nr:cuticle protein 12.5-like [Harmonia axyridis]